MGIRPDLNKQNDYIPHPWLKNSHLMTIVPGFLPIKNAIADFSHEALLIPVDKNSVVLAHAHIKKNISRCITIVHGLEGSSESPYILNLTRQALRLGFNVVRLNLRNCGNTLHLTPTLYNAGQSNDLLKVIAWLGHMKGQQEQYIAGYSLGGNLILKALAEMAENYSDSHFDTTYSIKGACAVSPSIDLAACVDCIGSGINRLYEYYFLRSLRKKILAKHKLFPKYYDLKRLDKVYNLRSFDDEYTAPHAGYDNAAHYYREASALPLINRIKTNTLIIAAQDDPLVPFKSFAHIDNSYVQLLIPQYGGHVSFLEWSFNNDRQNPFWADNQILSFFSKQVQIKESVVNA